MQYKVQWCPLYQIRLHKLYCALSTQDTIELFSFISTNNSKEISIRQLSTALSDTCRPRR